MGSRDETEAPDATLMADRRDVVGHSCIRCGTGEPGPHGTHCPLDAVQGVSDRETASIAEYKARAYELREAKKRAQRRGYAAMMTFEPHRRGANRRIA